MNLTDLSIVFTIWPLKKYLGYSLKLVLVIQSTKIRDCFVNYLPLLYIFWWIFCKSFFFCIYACIWEMMFIFQDSKIDYKAAINKTSIVLLIWRLFVLMHVLITFGHFCYPSMYKKNNRLVFNANFSSISAISWHEQILLFTETPIRPLEIKHTCL